MWYLYVKQMGVTDDWNVGEADDDWDNVSGMAEITYATEMPVDDAGNIGSVTTTSDIATAVDRMFDELDDLVDQIFDDTYSLWPEER